MTPLLELRELSVAYAGEAGWLTAVRGLSLSLEAGRALGLVGESGSGKSTVAGAVLDLLGPAGAIEGEIAFEGRDLGKLDHRGRRKLLGRRIGAVFQDPFTALNPAMSIGNHIAEPLIRHLGLPRRAALDRACELLADMHIANPREIAAAYPHQLSGGMRQRALIAAAIACEPSLLILDEPTTALDVTVEARILEILEELRRRKAVSLLFISHNLGVVRAVCDDLAVLYAGELLESGPAAAVLRRPRHPYTKGLIASMPPLMAGTRRGRLPSIPGQLPDLSAPRRGCIFEPRCPFAEPRCSEEAQALHPLGERRQARCWKEAQVPDWPLPAAAAAPPAATPERQALFRIVDLRKSFQLSRGLSALRVDLSGKGPVVSYRPHRLVAVDDVSLSLMTGEVLGLVGESGSGKSTLGRLILRLLSRSSGRIEFDGADVAVLRGAPLRAFRGSAQIVFQNADSSLNPRLSIGTALERPLVLFEKLPAAGRRRRVLELLDMVRLPAAYRTRYPHQLSGGEKQRVAIARALASRPRFIVCDEPVSALDVSVQAAIVNLMADLRDAFGLAYLFISHDLAVVAQLSDRIAVMYRGSLCETGSATEVLAPPYHPYTRMLLNAVPRIDAEQAPEPARSPAGATVPGNTSAGCAFRDRCPRKIGAICETTRPPLRPITATHAIACHLDLDRMR